jgi:hypothetical protein
VTCGTVRSGRCHLVCDIKRLLVSYLTREDNVRFGLKADVTVLNFDVRFTPESGH